MSAEYNSMCNWLNGHTHGSLKDFEAAMSIIESYMPDKAQRMRTLRSDSKIWELFVMRLDELDAHHPKAMPVASDIIPDIIPATIEEKISDKEPARLPIANMSQLIRNLEDKNKLILKNQGHLHAQLTAIGRNALGKPIHLSEAAKKKRKDLRDQIVGYEEQLRRNWHAIRHVQIYGHLPEPEVKAEESKPVSELDWHEMEKNRKSLVYVRSQIELKKKALSTLTGKKLIKAHAALDKLEKNLAERTKKHEEWQALKKKS